MAFGTPVAAAAAYSANNGTSVSPTYPAGILATDEVLLFVGQKPNAANGGTVTTPAGWTLRDELTAAGGYGATLGNDTGNTNLRVYSWNTPVAGQTGNLTVTVGTNGVCWAFMVRIPTGDGNVSFGSADGQQTTTPTSPLSVALTNGATATNFQAGDLAIWAMCVPTDAGGGTTFSAHTISATGATFGATTELNEPSSGTGQDIGGVSVWANVTAGSSTAAPTIGATLTGTLTNIRGPVVLLRIRETNSFLTQNTRFTNTPQFFGPTITTGPVNVSPPLFTNTPQFFAATSASPVTISQIAFGPANSFNYSEQLNVTAGGWSIGNGVTVTADTTTAPDGTTTADSINYVTSSTDFRFVRIIYPVRPGQYYTASIYVKKNNYRYFGVRPATLGPGLGTVQEECVFDFDTESFVYTPPTSGVVSTGFVNVGNGWYRIFATAQVPFTRGGARAIGFALTDATGFEQGNTLPAGASVYAWGAQLELSTAPSTYVQTVATSPVQQQVPNVFFAPTVAQAGGTQTLTPALYTNTPQFFNATVTTANTLTPALYTNTPQFFAATINQTGGTQTLTPALYTNTPQFFAASISRTLTQNTTFTNTPQFFAATVSLTLTQNTRFTNTPQFFAPTVTAGTVTLTQNTRFTNTPQFFAPTVTAGAVTLTQNTRFTNTPQFFAPTVTAGTVTLTPALFTNTPQIFAPSLITDGTLTQNARFTNTPQFFTATVTVGAVTLAPALYTNTPQFFAPSLSLGLTQGTRFTNTPQFFTATLTAGAVTLTQNTRFTNTPQFFAPTVTAGAANLTPALFTNTPQFFAATLVQPAQVLVSWAQVEQVTATPLIQDTRFTGTPQFFAATVTTGEVTLTQNTRFTNTPQFFAPTVAAGAVTLTQNTRFTNTPQFFAPTVTSGAVTLTQNTRFTNTPAFFTATLTNVNALTPALYTNTPAFFTTSLTVVTPLVQATRFTNAPQFFGGVVQQGQFLTFEDYVVSGYVDPPGYVEYIAYFNNVFFTGNLELQIAVSGLQATGFVGTVDQTLESIIVPTGVQAVGGVGYVNIWGLVDDSQSAGWQNIDITQSVTWSAVIDSQTASWQDVDVTQGPGWQDEGACIC